MGAYGLDLGTFSPFLYAFREREMILDLFEEVCGARLTYSYITIGGAHDDLPRRLGRALPRVPRLPQAAHPRVSHAADDATTSSCKRTAEHRRPVEGNGPQLRLHRADAARLARPHARAIPTGTCARSSRTAATRRTTSTPWFRRSTIAGAGDRRAARSSATPGIASCAHAGGGREHQDRASRLWTAMPRPRDRTASSCRAIYLRGEAYVETECPRGQMGFYVVGRPGKERGAAARAGAVVELLQSERDQRNLPRLPHRRRAGHRRQHRHRHGRDRSMTTISASHCISTT